MSTKNVHATASQRSARRSEQLRKINHCTALQTIKVNRLQQALRVNFHDLMSCTEQYQFDVLYAKRRVLREQCLAAEHDLEWFYRLYNRFMRGENVDTELAEMDTPDL